MKNPFKKPTPATVDAEKSLEESVADVVDAMETIRAAAVGYRAKLEADGFSPTMAEAMAAGFHAQMMAKAFGG